MKKLAFCLLMLALTGCKAANIAKTDSGVPATDNPIKEVTPVEAETAVSKAYSQFIDVRTPEEYSAGHAARAVNIPLDTLPSSLDRLEKNEPVYLICESGGRSMQAATFLKNAGFKDLFNVTGGTAAWIAAVLPTEASETACAVTK